jgi:hypothetical protein
MVSVGFFIEKGAHARLSPAGLQTDARPNRQNAPTPSRPALVVNASRN